MYRHLVKTFYYYAGIDTDKSTGTDKGTGKHRKVWRGIF